MKMSPCWDIISSICIHSPPAKRILDCIATSEPNALLHYMLPPYTFFKWDFSMCVWSSCIAFRTKIIHLLPLEWRQPFPAISAMHAWCDRVTVEPRHVSCLTVWDGVEWQRETGRCPIPSETCNLINTACWKRLIYMLHTGRMYTHWSNLGIPWTHICP